MTEKLRSRRWKTVLTFATLAALGILIYAVRDQIAYTYENLSKVNLWLVFLVVPLELLNHYCGGKLYQGMFRILGERFRTRSMFRLSLELNFINSVFPSGGVSGFSYLSIRLKGEKISTARASLVQMMRFILIFISFQVLLFTGLLALAIGGKASDVMILVSGVVATLLLVVTLIIGYVIGSKHRINVFFISITRILNRLIHMFRRHQPETINIESARQTFDELHENYMLIRRNPGVLKKPLVFAFMANLTEIAAIYAVYVAFGQWVNPGAVILAYAVANFAGLISVLPGGIGIYEGLMTAVLAAGGIPAAVSLPVTFMYRIVNMLAQLPLGYYFYHRNLHSKPIVSQPL